MGQIINTPVDFNAIPNPPVGKVTLGYDLDNVLKQKDSDGNITIITGGTVYESGVFTLSADGSSATLELNGGLPSFINHKVKFDIVSSTGYVVGQTITNNTTGATGIVSNINGLTLTLNTLTTGTWANTNTITNGTDVTTINSGQSTYIITIPTIKTLKLAHFNTQADSSQTIYHSFGMDNGIYRFIKYASVGGGPSSLTRYFHEPNWSISANVGSSGYIGRISQINNNSFDIELLAGIGTSMTCWFFFEEN